MRKYLFMSMLAMAVGGHFLASADVANAARQKAPITNPKAAIAKPAANKPLTRKPVQKPAAQVPVRPAKFHKPKAQETHFHHKSSASCSSSSDSDRCKKNCCQYVISSKDINKGKGVIIDKPGVWCLDGNACFNPKPSQYAPPDPRAVQAAITVKAGVSNVIIDLCSYRLSQAQSGTSTQTPFVIGILVPDPDPTNPDPEFVGAESIYIKGDDAIIDGFSMYGVRIFAHTSDIEISDVTIKNTGHLASKALRPMVYGVPYLPHDSSLTSSFGPSFGVCGLSIGESTAFGEGPQFFTDVPTTQLNIANRTQNIRLENVNCLNNFMFGSWIKLATNITIDNCHFDYTWTDDPGSNTTPAYPALLTYGMVFSDGRRNGNTDPCNINVSVSNSTFNNTSIRGDYTTPLAANIPSYICTGIIENLNKNTTYTNCQFNSSSITFPNAVLATTQSAGYLAAAIQDTTFIDCSFDDIFNLGAVNGCHISGGQGNTPVKSARNIKFINCTANNLQCRTDLILPASPVNTRSVQGYSFSFMKDLYMENCQSADLYTSGPNQVGSFNAAFAPNSSSGAPATQVENWVFKNCTAARVRAVDGGLALGFNTFVPSGNSAQSLLYENCESTGHQALLNSVYPAWSNATSYAVGSLVSDLGVNYVSLANANLNNTPSTSPAFWSVTNTAPAAWVSTTTYALGAQVSFTDSTGHTNEYISTIAGNTGNYPNAPGGTTVPTRWVQTNWYPTWKSSATYQSGAIVAYNGVNYRSLVASNINFQPNTNPAQWSTTTNVVQTVAQGFSTEQNSLAGVDGPEVYSNCIASKNKGAPGPITVFGLPRYTAGFYSFDASGTIHDSCIATDNIYGFMLVNSKKCVYKNCSAYNNVNATGLIGEGFTDLGPAGTAAAPQQSTSMFEGNTAYNNGAGTAHVGPNGNYNIWVNAGTSIRPLLLECVNATSACVINLTNPGGIYLAGKHNLSTTNN